MRKEGNVPMSVADFKTKIARRIRDARKQGVATDVMKYGLVNLADIALNFDEPQTDEEALVRDIWNVANENEKQMLAGLVMRWVGEQMQ